MSIDTSGFYKVEDDIVNFAPNFVYGPFDAYTLTRDLHLTYTYPVDGWYWFDTIALAYYAFSLVPTDIELFTTDVLLTHGESIVSDWFDFRTLQVDSLRISHTRSGDGYSLEIDWSRDGITADLTEVLQAGGANNTSTSKMVATRYGRIRVTNTSTTIDFTAHRTIVVGRVK